MSERRTPEMEGKGAALRAEPNSSDLAADTVKCSALSLEDKRRIVHKISLSHNDASEFLQGCTRPELLQLICAEMGEERKYTGLAKSKMIEKLLKIVLQKNNEKMQDETFANQSLEKTNGSAIKKRKFVQHQQLTTEVIRVSADGGEREKFNSPLCQNLACQAKLGPDDAFCKRCSCCICHCYDDNKDPSLWLVCSSELPFQGNSCGLSCHLVCALKDERTGILKNGYPEKLDGGFCCVWCNKVNGLMGSLRKQLLVAKDARRVDALCHRISLSYQILQGTEQYKNLQTLVHTAVNKLRKEVGSLGEVSAVMARGIVNRLDCGLEVQNLCAIAIETIDFMYSRLYDPLPNASVKFPRSPSCRIKFEDVSHISVLISLASDHKIFEDVVIGYKLWHRKSCLTSYSKEPTCVLLRPNTKVIISSLCPSTEYCFRASPFSSSGELGLWESTLVTKATNEDCDNSSKSKSSPMTELKRSDEDKARNKQCVTAQTNSQRGSTGSSDSLQAPGYSRTDCHSFSRALLLEDIGDNSVKHALPTNDIPFVGSNSVPLETAIKFDTPNNNLPKGGDQSKSVEEQYEYCVKVIRWLECAGHMEKEFRVKFLTWFSLKASVEERRVVSAFIDVLIDEPTSLVDQLIDAFMDGICNKEKVDAFCNGKPTAKSHLCTNLWH